LFFFQKKSLGMIMSVDTYLPTSPYKWPENLAEIGLVGGQVRTLESAISQLRNELFKTDKKYLMALSRQSIKGYFGELLIPRRVIVYREKSIVVLNSKGPTPLKNEADGTVFKWGYNPDEGTYCLKKRIVSVEQKIFIDYLRRNAPSDGVEGFAEIEHVDIFKETSSYFQVYYPSLSTVFLKNTQKIPALDRLYYFQRALKAVHSLTFNPPSLTELNGEDHQYNVGFQFFIGDISPKTVGFCEIPKKDEIFECKFTGLESLANLNRIVRNPGWNAPEVVKFLQTSPSQTSIRTFNSENGSRSDTWSFALLAASILLGGFEVSKNLPHLLPKFHFINHHLRQRTHGIDDSEIVDLEQGEIDLEIAGILSTVEDSTPIGRCIRVWWSTIGMWLKVDPAKRPDLTRIFID
jgi:hypothetical protein